MSGLPEGWAQISLSEISLIEMGQSPSSETYNKEGVGLPFFQGKAEFRETYPEIKKWCSNPTKIAESGDILLSIRAPVGPTNLAPAQCCIGRGLAGIRSEKALNQNYLFYFFKNIETWLSMQGTGSTFAAISGQFIKEISVPLAPANEQIRIVEKLEELLSDLDAGVAELKAAQKKLVQYRQSLLKAAVEGALTAEWRKTHQPEESGAQLLERILKQRRVHWEAKQLAKFQQQGKTPPNGWQKKYPEPVKPDTSDLPELPDGWVWASLEQISEIQGGIQKQPSRTPIKNKFPFLRVANVARGQLKLDEIHEIELFDGEIERLALKKDDILIVEGNGSLTEIGRCALWDGSIPNAVHQNHLIRARPIDMRCEFVEAWLNSLHGIEKLTKLAATTSGLYTLSVGKISKIPVPVPPVSEQTEAVSLLNLGLEEHVRQNAAIKFAIKQSAAQRKNILKAAFSGQLVAQDPNDEPASVLLERIRAERAAQALNGKLRKRSTANA